MTLNVAAALKRVKEFAGRSSGPDLVSPYYNENAVNAGVRQGKHRDLIGGLWEEVGAWQLDLLKSEGLKPHHRLLDVGCGSFRGGVKFVDYLEPNSYYGFDLSGPLIDAGYAREITANGLAEKLPKENLCVSENFSCENLGGKFDFALAVSVFTHLPLNYIRLALEKLAPELRPGGAFFATFFLIPEHVKFGADHPHEPAGVVTHPTADPYHCRISDVVHLAAGLPWKALPMEINDHARGQRVVKFVKTA